MRFSETSSFRELTGSLCSSAGSLTNPGRISGTVASNRGIKADSETIGTCLSYLTDSFLFSRADRYDVKGKRYFGYPSKYYCADIGLRNVRPGLKTAGGDSYHGEHDL